MANAHHVHVLGSSQLKGLRPPRDRAPDVGGLAHVQISKSRRVPLRANEQVARVDIRRRRDNRTLKDDDPVVLVEESTRDWLRAGHFVTHETGI